jgi:hypothetical protein
MLSLQRSAVLTVFLVGASSLAAVALAGSGWTVVSAPAPNTNVIIDGAAARTDTDVWAVGTAFGTAGSAPPPPIAYHWNGSAWSRVPTPNLGVPAGLFAVSASTASDAWAVGFRRAGGYRSTNSLFERWNGSTWSLTGGVDVGRLVGVADLSPTNAWAVSATGLLEHWNGTAWTTVASPQPNPSNTFGNRVSAMSASGPADVWAVGTYTTPSYTTEVYALHYNGVAWSLVRMAQPAGGSPAIGGVTALSSTNAWAVGEAGGAVLAEHWDGASWKLLPAAPQVSYPSLTAVAARSASDVWAVGSQVNGAQSALLLHWDGITWSNSPSPTGATSSALYAAATNPGGSRVWAFGPGSAGQSPLILSHR